MKNMKNAAIIAVLVIIVAVVVVAKRSRERVAASDLKTKEDVIVQPATMKRALPRLVDLGADKCIPCKMMAPILEELKNTYADVLEVEFIDVWKDQRAGEQYRIRVIPTQIFYDAGGKELFRHEGFFAKEDILAKWKEFGVELPPGTSL